MIQKKDHIDIVAELAKARKALQTIITVAHNLDDVGELSLCTPDDVEPILEMSSIAIDFSCEERIEIER